MFATKEEVFCLEIHQYLLKYGFNSLLLNFSDFRMRNRNNILFFHTVFSEQAERPSGYPAGRGASAVAITFASKSPVIFEATGGVIRVFFV